MFRNSTLSNPYNTSYQSYQRQNSLSKAGNSFNQSRSPLYPIGPTISHQQMTSMIRGPSPSPYLTSKQGFKTPSYQQKYLQTSMNLGGQRQMNIHGQRQYTLTGLTYQQKQKRLIQRNQLQIQEQQKRRQSLRISYQRQIQNLNKVLLRNMQRKQKLLYQIQNLQHVNQQYHQKLSTLAPPKQSISLLQPLDRKQQDIIITKNKLLSSIREKQEQYLKQQEQEEQYWQNQLKQKQKILFTNQQQIQRKRIQLKTNKTSLQKPDLIAIQDQVRQNKYKDFIYEAQLIQNKINHLIKQRQTQQREVNDTLNNKRHNIHTLQIKHQQLNRQCTTSRIRADQLERVSMEMQAANDNLLHQLQRKQKMIEKYQLDIHTLKQTKTHQQQNLNKMMNDARSTDYNQMQANINEQILKIQEQIRHQTSITNRLKTQYQKIYEILCSTASRNIHQTFNQTLMI